MTGIAISFAHQIDLDVFVALLAAVGTTARRNLQFVKHALYQHRNPERKAMLDLRRARLCRSLDLRRTW